MIEKLIDRIANGNKGEVADLPLKTAAIQLLVGSLVKEAVELEVVEYLGEVELFRADRKFLVVPGNFCSCAAPETRRTCAHLVAVAMRPVGAEVGSSGAVRGAEAEKFVAEIFESLSIYKCCVELHANYFHVKLWNNSLSK